MKKCFEHRRNEGLLYSGPITTHYMEGYYSNLDEHVMVREARAFMNLYSNAEQPLFEDELIAGSLPQLEPVCFEYGGGTRVVGRVVKKYIAQQGMSEAEEAEFRAKLAEIDSRANHGGIRPIFDNWEANSIRAYAATTNYFGGHIVPDHETILAIGLGGYKHKIAAARARNADEPDFYEALDTMVDAIGTFFKRYAKKAGEIAAAQTDPAIKKRFERMKADLAWLATEPPQNFGQAIQMYWIIHMLFGCDSFGRFDTYLLPYYTKSINDGTITRAEALELIEAFWIKLEEVNAIQNMTIGGTNPDGTPAFSELTELCLIATYEIGYKGPNLCLLTTPEMPEILWDLAMKCIESGLGLPALYSDAMLVQCMRKAGIAEHDLNKYSLAGCSQLQIPGRSNFVNDIGLLNVSKCLEITLNGGIDPASGIQVGLPTQKFTEMCCFDDLMAVFKAQMAFFCSLECSINEKDTVYRREREGYVMRTLFVQDCIGTGKAIYHGGALYNSIELECIGITNTADSLAAIKKAVFEDGIATASELMDALAANFEGHEPLRRYLMNNVPKFGNDDRYVDSIREEITAYIFKQFNDRTTIIGGKFIPGEVIFVVHESAGQAVGATPDGRLAGTVLADSAGSVQGMDKRGPTALMNSMKKIPCDYALTNVILNIRFMKKYFVEPGSALRIKQLLKSYLADGGMQVQVNTVDAQTLREAEADPDKYASLVVRVGGYSDYFVKLSPALRAEIMARTEHELG